MRFLERNARCGELLLEPRAHLGHADAREGDGGLERGDHLRVRGH
jgi:hypothetical protein